LTYCLAIAVDQGLVFASDSRTNAGPDQVSAYSKMHLMGVPGERQFVLLCAGNLATTQGVLAQIRRDMQTDGGESLLTVTDMTAAADYVGATMRNQDAKHGEAVARAGFSADSTFILGGQIGQDPPAVYLIYPQGNYITTSDATPYIQIGETKYGKPILDRVIHRDTSLEEAARCALVSMDSSLRSNMTVGPPIELLCYERNALRFTHYLSLDEDDSFLLRFRREWNERAIQAFRELPEIVWGPIDWKPGH